MEMLDVLSNPKHEEHEAMRDWAGDFDAEQFSTADATRRMRRGLPNWRI
jgi:pRiA4b ORF-3-like protein